MIFYMLQSKKIQFHVLFKHVTTVTRNWSQFMGGKAGVIPQLGHT